MKFSLRWEREGWERSTRRRTRGWRERSPSRSCRRISRRTRKSGSASSARRKRSRPFPSANLRALRRRQPRRDRVPRHGERIAWAGFAVCALLAAAFAIGYPARAQTGAGGPLLDPASRETLPEFPRDLARRSATGFRGERAGRNENSLGAVLRRAHRPAAPRNRQRRFLLLVARRALRRILCRGKWQVSTDGGVQPRWRRDGKESSISPPIFA